MTSETRPNPPARDPRPPVDEERSAFLSTLAHDVGTAWSVAVRAALHAQGRRTEGAFPGTLGEARARVAGGFDRALAASSREGLAADERVDSTKRVYAAARRHWKRHEESA